MRLRPDRCRDVGLPAPGDRARHRHARQADGQRPPGRRGHHAARPGASGSRRKASSSAPSAATRSRWPPRWPCSRSSTTSGSSRTPREVGEYLARPAARGRLTACRRSARSARSAWRSASRSSAGHDGARPRRRQGDRRSHAPARRPDRHDRPPRQHAQDPPAARVQARTRRPTGRSAVGRPRRCAPRDTTGRTHRCQTGARAIVHRAVVQLPAQNCVSSRAIERCVRPKHASRLPRQLRTADFSRWCSTGTRPSGS